MKPLLAGELTDPTKLRFPVYVSPKYDGIRALVIDGKLVSRSLKAIPNTFIRLVLSSHRFNGLDGELVVGDTFQATTSAVMSEAGEPDFTFYVFDDFTDPSAIFDVRTRCASMRVATADAGKILHTAPRKLCFDFDEVMAQHSLHTMMGYEGTMIRSPDGVYKFGRSTEREGILLKLKNFKDLEAVIVGFEELLYNDNPATIDALGHQTRGASKKHLVPAGTLGALIVEHPDFGRFKVGTGFDAQLRQVIWSSKALYLGKLAKIRYQPDGTKLKPRIPSFQGIRDPRDL